MNYTTYRAAVCCAMILVVGIQVQMNAQQLAWRKIQPMSTARFFSKAAAISDHEVLVVGGYTSSNSDSRTCEMIDVLTGTVAPAQSLLDGRYDFSMVQLADSNLVVLGGDNDGLVGSIEMYDRGLKKWSKIGDLLVPRRQLTAILISATKILTVGGRNSDLDCLRDCEVFDLITKKSHKVQNFPVITSLCQVERTSDGTIVAFGGREGGPGSERQKELYAFDLATERWSLHGAYLSKIYFPYIVTLPNGKLFSTGGSYKETGSSDNTYSDQIAIESSKGFDSVGHLNGLRALHCAALLDNDRVIVIGGADEDGVQYSTCELVDPMLGTSVAGPELNEARDLFNVVRLKPASLKGKMIDAVLVAVGGRAANNVILNSVEVLDVFCDGQKLLDLMATTSDIRVNGSAEWFGKRLRLTDTAQNDSGSFWYARRISIKSGFETDFMFRIGSGSDRSQPDGGDPGADGITFVVQNSSLNAIGHYGKGIGYDGIAKSIAVEFDTYFNFECNDPSGNHVAVQTGGLLANQSVHKAPYLLGSTNTVQTIHNDGRPYFGRIAYDGYALYVYVNETGIFDAPVLTVTNVNISSLIGLGTDPTVWMGFTSATGIAWAQHEILSWTVHGCVEARVPSAVEDDHATSIEPVRVELSPNPVSSILSIKLHGEQLFGTTIQILDVRGATLLINESEANRASGGTVQMDVSSLPVGCYVIRVSQGNMAVTAQLIVLH